MRRLGRHAWTSAILAIAWSVVVAPLLLAQTDAPAPPFNSFSDPQPPAPAEFAPDPPKAQAVYHPQWELSSEMTYFLFRSPSPRFPLATIGNVADTVPGALGQPGTKVIADASTFKEGFHIGTKITGTYWFCGEPEALGIQVSGFSMEHAPSLFTAANSGGTSDPVLARPFFNGPLGREDSDPRAVPGAMAGDIHIRFGTRFYGGDGSFLYNVTGYSHYGPSLFVLAGPRLVIFDERYSSNETAVDIPPLPANVFHIQDSFYVHNVFMGGQVGTMVRYRIEGVTFDLLTKVAAGNNRERLTIDGFTSVTDQATGLTTVGQQGLFAQPSNIGQYTRDTFSVIPEVAAKLHVDLTQTIKITLGYGFLAMTQVARPADQLDRNINIQPLGSPVQVGPAFPVRPTTINQTTFWTHYFNLGIEFVF